MGRLLNYAVLAPLLLLAGTHGWAACSQTTVALQSMHQQQISLIDTHGDAVVLDVRIADDQLERAGGFQHLCAQLVARSAILFVYGDEANRGFHMRNVHAPLDIGFFDRNGALVSVMFMQPYAESERTVYSPRRVFKYALEVPQGFFRKHGIEVGTSQLRLAD